MGLPKKEMPEGCLNVNLICAVWVAGTWKSSTHTYFLIFLRV